jgi:hypothetical protein
MVMHGLTRTLQKLLCILMVFLLKLRGAPLDQVALGVLKALLLSLLHGGWEFNCLISVKK